jgi:hypothetical protein
VSGFWSIGVNSGALATSAFVTCGMYNGTTLIGSTLVQSVGHTYHTVGSPFWIQSSSALTLHVRCSASATGANLTNYNALWMNG